MQSNFILAPRSQALLRIAGGDRLLIVTMAGGLTCLGLVLTVALGRTLMPAVALGVLITILYNPRIGLLAIYLTTALDSAEYDPIASPSVFLYKSIHGLLATPIEILVLWTALATIIACIHNGELRIARSAFLVLSAAFTALLVLAMMYGWNHGGNFTVALWETRAILLVLPVLFLTKLLVKRKSHV